MDAQGLGKNIKRLRLQRGLTQAQLAGADWTKAYISLLENGRVAPSVKSLQVLADKLGCSVSDLVESDVQPGALHAAETALMEGDLQRAWSAVESVPHSSDWGSALLTLQCEVAAKLVKAETEEFINEALNLKSLSKTDRARVLNAWGIYNSKTGRAAEALEKFETARDLLQDETKDIPLKLRVLANCGNFQAQAGQYEVALSRLQEHLTLSSNTRIQSFTSYVYTTMGVVYRHLQDYHASELFLRRALFAFRAEADNTMEGVALNDLGMLYVSMGRLEDAVASFGEALQTFSAEDPRRSATLLELAYLHASRQEFASAVADLKQCLTAHLEPEDAVRYWTLRARCERAGGNPEEALKLIGHAIEGGPGISPSVHVTVLQEEAFILMELGRIREAQEAVQQSIGLASRGG